MAEITILEFIIYGIIGYGGFIFMLTTITHVPPTIKGQPGIRMIIMIPVLFCIGILMGITAIEISPESKTTEIIESEIYANDKVHNYSIDEDYDYENGQIANIDKTGTITITIDGIESTLVGGDEYQPVEVKVDTVLLINEPVKLDITNEIWSLIHFVLFLLVLVWIFIQGFYIFMSAV